MKPKNTVVLVIIAHVGLFLIWMCMGGCSVNRETADIEDIRPNDVRIPGPEDERIGMGTTEIVREGTIVDTMTESPVRKESRRFAEFDPETELKYIVQSGDSLWKISRKFSVGTEEIIDRNDIQDENRIREGRVLYIPKRPGVTVEEEEPSVETTVDETVETETETATEEVATVDTVPASTEEPELDESQYITHEIVSGDTIWKLARTYGVTTQDIIKANNIDDPRKIQIGQKLLIPKK